MGICASQPAKPLPVETGGATPRKPILPPTVPIASSRSVRLPPAAEACGGCFACVLFLVALALCAIQTLSVAQAMPFCDTRIPVEEAAEIMSNDELAIAPKGMGPGKWSAVESGWNEMCDTALVDKTKIVDEFGPYLNSSAAFEDNAWTPYDYKVVRIRDWELIKPTGKPAAEVDVLRTVQVQLLNTPTWLREQVFFLSIPYAVCAYVNASFRVIATSDGEVIPQVFHKAGGPTDDFAYVYDILEGHGCELYGGCRVTVTDGTDDHVTASRRCYTWSRIPGSYTWPAVPIIVAQGFLTLALALAYLAQRPSATPASSRPPGATANTLVSSRPPGAAAPMV